MGYSYSAPQWLLVFFLYCVLGWCFETTVVSVKQRHFVNRGGAPAARFAAAVRQAGRTFFREHGRRDDIRVYCRRRDGKTV